MIMRYSFNWNDYKPRNDRGYKGRWSQGGTMQISSYFFSHPYGLILNKRNKWVTNQWWEKVNASTLPLHTSRVSSCTNGANTKRNNTGLVIFSIMVQPLGGLRNCHHHIWWQYSSLMCHCHNRKSISQCRWFSDASEENGAYVADGDWQQLFFSCRV